MTSPSRLRRPGWFAFGAAAFLFGSLLATQPTRDPDLWWHLADGRYFLSNGVPNTDPFSLTMRGATWVVHEWLADIFMFQVQDSLGLLGLSIVFGLLVGGAWLAVYAAVPGDPLRKVVLIGIAAAGVAPVVAARPQMNTLVLLALLIGLTERIRAGAWAPTWFWLVVPMVILWANLHAGFYTAFAYLGVVAVGSIADRRFGDGQRALSNRAVGHLAAVLIVAFFGIALTPHGTTLWTYPFATLGDPVTQRSLVEWLPPTFHNRALWFYLLYVVVGLVGIAIRRPRPDLIDILLYAGTLAASLFSVRHIALHGIVSLPVVMRLWASTPSEDDEAGEPRQSLLPVIVLVAAIAGYGLMVNRIATINDRLVEQRFPVGALGHLQESSLDDSRIYNDFPWGGYLLWNGVTPFIDGRTDMYGPEFLEGTLDTLFLREDWRGSLDRYDIETVLLTQESPLAAMLGELDGWDEVFRDEQAVIFVRG